MAVVDMWMEKLEQDLGGEDMNRLAERVARWHARGDQTVLAYLMLKELGAIRTALDTLTAAGHPTKGKR
jgi:hypothetical protein